MTRASGVATARAVLSLACIALSSGCTRGDAAAEQGAPPPAVVAHEGDGGVIAVEHPERFPVVKATERDAAPALSVTGVVSPDVGREVPVVSLASGRVTDIRARLGDHVARGQLLLRIHSTDVSSAFADYERARADVVLARAQLERAQALYARGAIARKDLEIAQDAADKAEIDLNACDDRLRVLGVDATDARSGVVDVVAPVSGVITEQNVTGGAGVRTLDNSPNLFTISDLSHVWIMCDVYENDLPAIRLGDTADIRLDAYPDRRLAGRIDNIGAVLDPTLRTAKVRVQVANPGLLRLGMFVTATFHGLTKERRTVVPASAVLHLHDREWVYVPDGRGRFRRVEVVGGARLPGGAQELKSGLTPGQDVVVNALVLQSTVEP